MKQKFLENLTKMINIIEDKDLRSHLDKKKKIIKKNEHKILKRKIQHYRSLLNEEKQKVQKIKAEKNEFQIQFNLMQKQNDMLLKRDELLQSCLQFLQQEKNNQSQKLQNVQELYTQNFNEILKKLQNLQISKNQIEYKLNHYQTCFDQVKNYMQQPNAILQNFQNTIMLQDNQMILLGSIQKKFEDYFQQYQKLTSDFKLEIQKRNQHEETQLQNKILNSLQYQDIQRYFITESFVNFPDVQQNVQNQNLDINSLLNLKNFHESLVQQNEAENQIYRLQSKVDQLKKICQNLIYENGSFRELILKLQPQKNLKDLFLKEDFIISQTLYQKNIYDDIGLYLEKLFNTKLKKRDQKIDSQKRKDELQNQVDLKCQQLEIRDKELKQLRQENLKVQQRNSQLEIQVQSNNLQIKELQNHVASLQKQTKSQKKNNFEVQQFDTNKIENVLHQKSQKLQNYLTELNKNIGIIQQQNIKLEIRNINKEVIDNFEKIFKQKLEKIQKDVQDSNCFGQPSNDSIMMQQLYGSFPLYYINKLIKENNSFYDLKNLLKDKNSEHTIYQLQEENKDLLFELNKIKREKELAKEYAQKTGQGDIIKNSELQQEIEYQNKLIKEQNKQISSLEEKIQNLNTDLQQQNNKNQLIKQQLADLQKFYKELQFIQQQQKKIYQINQKNQIENKNFLRKQILSLLKLNVFQQEKNSRKFKIRKNFKKCSAKRIIL